MQLFCRWTGRISTNIPYSVSSYQLISIEDKLLSKCNNVVQLVFLPVEASVKLIFWPTNSTLTERKLGEVNENYTRMIYSDASNCGEVTFMSDMNGNALMTK